MANRHTKTPDQFQAYFWGRVEPIPMCGCWIWTGPLTDDGYGKQGSRLAHRISWELVRGAIPSGLGVLHRCDVRACVNPEHLFLGTHDDNMGDMRRKGRRKGVCLGEHNGRARLSPTAVAEIRAIGRSVRLIDLAPRYGVSLSTISRALRGECWSKNHEN